MPDSYHSRVREIKRRTELEGQSQVLSGAEEVASSICILTVSVLSRKGTGWEHKQEWVRELQQSPSG